MNDLLLAAMCIGLGLALTLRTRNFLRTARRVRGEVIGYNASTDSEGDCIYTPVFRFLDEGGDAVKASNPRTGSGMKKYTIGCNCA